MAYFRRAVLALALAGSGLAATTGAALATEDHHQDTEGQSGLVNADDTQTVVPTDVCGNNVPVNVLGVQIPVQDADANVPVLSGSDDNGGNGSGVTKSCGSDADVAS